LAEFLPNIYPYSPSVMFLHQTMMTMFLPTRGTFCAQPNAFYWVTHLFDVWSWCSIARTFDLNMLEICSRLAKDQYGRIAPACFQPLHRRHVLDVGMRWMELPIGSGLSRTANGGLNVGSKNTLSSGWVPASATIKHYSDAMEQNALFGKKSSHLGRFLANFIVFNISPADCDNDNSMLAMLESMLRAVESFFHPSNSGRWAYRLTSFVQSIASALHRRLQDEKRMETGHIPDHEAYGQDWRLTQPICRRIADALLAPLLLAMFSKDNNVVNSSHSALLHLAWIDPELILPKLLDRIYPSLETLTEVRDCFQNWF
jgi:proteasome activator subunit 4